ncbi:hypothetical protein [Providencia manganoxydans]|uniref:hypothetical protein n=1 Tax=Providencia manganoxydans TaxID=2923283 RepID=UPI0029408E49|nr:hypothetical protein [Providencia stuartii]ELR5083009.1 hypothetical protein [Providencia stuartii]
MDIESISLEKGCFSFKEDFLNCFDWNHIDFSFSKIDLNTKEVSTLSSNYEWLLMYWDADLDLNISERLGSGIQLWNDYSSAHMSTLAKTKKNRFKIDFCFNHENVFEVASVNSNKELSIADIIAIYKCRPTISDYADRLWKNHQQMVLPMRENIILPAVELQSENKKMKKQPIDIHGHMKFDGVRFTRKEMLTIRMLLAQCRVKEISAIHGCSENSEHKRIMHIKEKLGCPHASPSGLFKVFKERGITLACLDTLINFPKTQQGNKK